MGEFHRQVAGRPESEFETRYESPRKESEMTALYRAFLIAGMITTQAFDAMADVHRCTNDAGEVTFSDAPCPTGTEHEAVPTWKLDRPPAIPDTAQPEYNPYSLENQAQMIEARDRRQRRASDLQRIKNSGSSHAALANAQEAISGLNSDESQINRFLQKQEFAPQWVLDDLAQIQAQREALIEYVTSMRESIAEQQARARQIHTQNMAYEALERARQANIRAMEAEEKARRAEDAAHQAEMDAWDARRR